MPPEALQFNTTTNLTALALILAWDDANQSLNPFLQSSKWQCTDQGSGPFTDLGETLQCKTDPLVGNPRDGEFRGGKRLADGRTRILVLGEEDLRDVQTRCLPQCEWKAWPVGSFGGVPPTVNVKSALTVVAFYDLDPEELPDLGRYTIRPS